MRGNLGFFFNMLQISKCHRSSREARKKPVLVPRCREFISPTSFCTLCARLISPTPSALQWPSLDAPSTKKGIYAYLKAKKGLNISSLCASSSTRSEMVASSLRSCLKTKRDARERCPRHYLKKTFNFCSPLSSHNRHMNFGDGSLRFCSTTT